MLRKLFLCKKFFLFHILFVGDNMKLSEMPKNHQQTKIDDEKHNNLNKSYDELKDLSSDELFDRLAKEIQKQKTNGTFDYDGLKKSIDSIKIYLPNQTYENMLRIIKSLK